MGEKDNPLVGISAKKSKNQTDESSSQHRTHHIEGDSWRTASQLFACDLSELTSILVGQEVNVQG